MPNTNLLRSAKIVEFIEIGVLEGDGTEENVNRIVLYYVTTEGKVVFRIDDWEVQQIIKEVGG